MKLLREVELRAVPDGFQHTKGDADQITQNKAGQAQEDGNGKPRLDDVPDRILIDVGRSEIELQDIPQPGA